MQMINPDISLRQKEIIIGTVLGGSSLVKPSKGKNCYLSMRDRDSKWLQYKASSLNNLSSDAPFTLPKKGNTFRWHSMCYPIFTKLYQMFYNNGNRDLTKNILDPLKDWGLSVWFVDCGKYKKNHILFNTNIWGDHGTEVAKNYFENLGYGVKIIKKRIIQLDEESSRHFLEIITPPLTLFVQNACKRR
jgi:hypothetical protein